MLQYAMHALKNPRHEIFAQRVASGMPAGSAYAAAGFQPDRGHASRLASNGNVSERITELQREAGGTFGMDRQQWLSRLESNANDCRAEGKLSGERQALREIGQALSFYSADAQAGTAQRQAEGVDPLEELCASPSARGALISGLLKSPVMRRELQDALSRLPA